MICMAPIMDEPIKLLPLTLSGCVVNSICRRINLFSETSSHAYWLAPADSLKVLDIRLLETSES